ncbi:hypothetical protein AAVH_31001, partial [Aphelenchoides avenae]
MNDNGDHDEESISGDIDDDSGHENDEHDATIRPEQEEQQAGKKSNESGSAAPEVRRAAHEVERIIEHGMSVMHPWARARTTFRASDMAAKFKEDAIFKDHWQIRSGLLNRTCTRETTIYRIRWRGFSEEDDTFQEESSCCGDPVFEDYVKQQNLHAPSRCLMPTDKTMERVRYNLRRGRRAVEYFGPLKAAANDINMRFAGGQRAAKALQDCYQPSRVHRRLVYMLLDGGILAETAANCTSRPLVKFGQAAFYIGKGTVDRPFKHLEEARNYLLEPNSQQKQ